MMLDLTGLLFLPPTCRAGFVVVHPRGRGAGAADLRPTGAPHPERREVQGVAARRDAHLNNPYRWPASRCWLVCSSMRRGSAASHTAVFENTQRKDTTK